MPMCVSGLGIQRRENSKEKGGHGWRLRVRESGEAWRWEIQQLQLFRNQSLLAE